MNQKNEVSRRLGPPFLARGGPRRRPWLPKPTKWIPKGCPPEPRVRSAHPNMVPLGAKGAQHHAPEPQTWCHLGPRCPTSRPGAPKRCPQASQGHQKGRQRYQKYMSPADCAERLTKLSPSLFTTIRPASLDAMPPGGRLHREIITSLLRSHRPHGILARTSLTHTATHPPHKLF